jgi:hypothetical protein
MNWHSGSRTWMFNTLIPKSGIKHCSASSVHLAFSQRVFLRTILMFFSHFLLYTKSISWFRHLSHIPNPSYSPRFLYIINSCLILFYLYLGRHKSIMSSKPLLGKLSYGKFKFISQHFPERAETAIDLTELLSLRFVLLNLWTRIRGVKNKSRTSAWLTQSRNKLQAGILIFSPLLHTHIL